MTEKTLQDLTKLEEPVQAAQPQRRWEPRQALKKNRINTSLVGASACIFCYICPGDIPNSMDCPYNIDVFVDVSIA